MKKVLSVNLICWILIIIITATCSYFTIDKYKKIHKKIKEPNKECSLKCDDGYDLDSENCKCEKIEISNTCDNTCENGEVPDSATCECKNEDGNGMYEDYEVNLYLLENNEDSRYYMYSKSLQKTRIYDRKTNKLIKEIKGYFSCAIPINGKIYYIWYSSGYEVDYKNIKKNLVSYDTLKFSFQEDFNNINPFCGNSPGLSFEECFHGGDDAESVLISSDKGEGVATEYGKILIEPIYDSIESRDCHYLVEKDNLYGLFDENFELKLDLKNKYFTRRGNYYFTVDEKDNLIIYNLDFKTISKIESNVSTNNLCDGTSSLYQWPTSSECTYEYNNDYVLKYKDNGKIKIVNFDGKRINEMYFKEIDVYDGYEYQKMYIFLVKEKDIYTKIGAIDSTDLLIRKLEVPNEMKELNTVPYPNVSKDRITIMADTNSFETLMYKINFYDGTITRGYITG